LTGSPQAELQLILLSAGTTARRQSTGNRADELLASVDWQRLTERLRARKLLPTLGPRVIEIADGSASADFCAAVNQAIDAGRLHGAFLQLVSLRAIAMLADEGIRSAALKGPLLGEAIYGDPGRRQSSDIDLLVAPEQLQLAVEVIRRLGYRAPTDYVDDSGLPLLHLMLVHERDELPPIEIHWRIHWYEREFAQDRLLPPTSNVSAGWRPTLADELAALLLFYARDGLIDLRLVSDLSAWWDMHGADVPTGALDELLQIYPAFVRAIPVAARAAELLVGLPAMQIMPHTHNLGLRGRIAARLANPHPNASRSQLYADMGLIDGLLTPVGGFPAFVRRQVLPPSEVLSQQARHASRRRARSPAARSVGVLTRYALTMARLVRPTETLR
jgi:Uncharacterised nucleotidyltransferase